MQDYVNPLSPSLANAIPRLGYYPLPQASFFYNKGLYASRFGYSANDGATGDQAFLTEPKTRSAPYLQDFFGYWLGHNEPNAKDDPLQQFMEGKKHFLTRGIEDVLGLIQERVQIKYDNLRKITYDSSKTKGMLFQLYRWQIGGNPNVDRLRMGIEKELIGLEREKRMEEVNCWRDVTRLRTEMRELLGETAQEKRRDSLLSNNP